MSDAGRKASAALRTIGEVSADLSIPQHILRFWESKFTQLRPVKRSGNRRYYRPDDVALIQRIDSLLNQDGYTIAGVQRLLRKPQKIQSADSAAAATSAPSEADNGAEGKTVQSDSSPHIVTDVAVPVAAGAPFVNEARSNSSAAAVPPQNTLEASERSERQALPASVYVAGLREIRAVLQDALEQSRIA